MISGSRGNYILYNHENFTQKNFCNFIINNFSLNSTYCITVKIRFRVNTSFYKCERNIALTILD